LGSGPGRDAIFLTGKGLHPVCVDISDEMIKICHEKGLEAYRMDIEDLDLKNASFDGVWAYTSLVHIPKTRLCNALARIKELLKPRGLFFVGMIEGTGEIMYQSHNQPGKERFFARYTDEEFREALGAYFEIVAAKKFTTSKGEAYLNNVCQKPEKEFIYSTLNA
jgi:SAM-dependent methyltransferase